MKNKVLKIGIIAVVAFLLVVSFAGCDSAPVSETTTEQQEPAIQIPDDEKIVIPSLECFLGIKAETKTFSDDNMEYTLRFADAFNKYPQKAIDDYTQLLKNKYNLVEKDDEAQSQENSSLLRLYDPETDRCIVDIARNTFVTGSALNLSGEYNEIIKDEALKKANSIMGTYFEVCFSYYALTQDKEVWDGNICSYLSDSKFEEKDCPDCYDGDCPECYGRGRITDADGGRINCSNCNKTGKCKKCTNGIIKLNKLKEFEYFYNPSDWVDCTVCGGDGLGCISCFTFGDSEGHLCSSDKLCKQESCVAGKVSKQK